MFFCASAGGASAADVEKVIPHQVFIREGKLTVYFDIMGNRGQSVLHVQPNQVSMTFDDKGVKAERFSPFANTGEGVGTVLLIDLSLSLAAPNFMQAKQALTIWVDSMTASDRVAIIAFGGGVGVLSPFTHDRELLKSLISGLRMEDGATQLNDAIMEAYKIATIRDETLDLPDRRVIVALSDGIHQAATGATRDEIVKKIEESQIPFHSIAYEAVPKNAAERVLIDQGKEALSTYSRISGGVYYPQAQNRLAEAYAGINARIRNSYVIVGDISSIQGDGQFHRMQIDYTEGGRTLSEGMNVRYAPTQSAKSGLGGMLPVIAVLGGLALIALFFIAARERKRKMANQTPDSPKSQPIAPPVSQPQTPPKPAAVIPTRPAGVEITLTPVGTSGAQPYKVVVSDRIEIGRGKNCTVSLQDDSAISSQHCEISWSNGVLSLRDLDSTNGTSVNGVPIKNPYKLKPGDTIGLGRAQLRLGEMREA